MRGRDMKSAVEHAKQAVANQIKLPDGVSFFWVGEYSELQKANRRFAVVIPLALLLIMAVLYASSVA